MRRREKAETERKLGQKPANEERGRTEEKRKNSRKKKRNGRRKNLLPRNALSSSFSPLIINEELGFFPFSLLLWVGTGAMQKFHFPSRGWWWKEKRKWGGGNEN